MAREKQPHRYEGLLRAVLLFHRGGPWTEDDQRLFAAYTQSENVNGEATTRNLCEAIREALGDA